MPFIIALEINTPVNICYYVINLPKIKILLKQERI